QCITKRGNNMARENLRLADKVAIVTGSTKGIGRVIATTMASEGAKVVLTGRTVKRGEEMVAAITEAGGEAVFVPCDVAKGDDIRCNTIVTGMILPPQAVPGFESHPALGTKLHSQHLTRIGRREDIAWGAVYLASDESGFITGAELPIDGGAPIISNLLTKRE